MYPALFINYCQIISSPAASTDRMVVNIHLIPNELLDRGVFATLEEARVLIEERRREYIRYAFIVHWVTGHQPEEPG
jgi:hypothetical protein